MATRVTAACGTPGGYLKHKRQRTEPCDACRRANADYITDWRRRNPNVKIESRQRERARSRALSRLAALYPADYDRLLKEELVVAWAEDQTE